MQVNDDSPSNILNDPNWLLHRYDETVDEFWFVHAPRDIRQQATFLIDEFLPAAVDPVKVRRVAAAAIAAPEAPVHFIFHSAYCCSTLVARVFDRPGEAMALREPVVLNDLSGWQRRGATARAVTVVLDDALRLLARPDAAGEAVVIKPSNVVNALAPTLLALRPQSRALLLYAPLPVYLGSIARKGIWGRLWVRELLVKQMDDGTVDRDLVDGDPLRLSDLQVAALGWIAQHRLFAQMIERFGEERVRTMSSEALLANPREAVGALGQLFGMNWSAGTVAAIAEGDIFRRHAKLDEVYGFAERQHEQATAEQDHEDEIGDAAEWAKEASARLDQSLNLPAGLI